MNSQVDETHIYPVVDQRGQLLIGSHLQKAEGYRWLLAMKLPQHWSEFSEHDGAHKANADDVAATPSEPLRLKDRCLRLKQNDPCSRYERSAGRSQLHASRGPRKEFDPQLRLKIADTACQRRLRDIQPLRGAAEIELVGDR